MNYSENDNERGREYYDPERALLAGGSVCRPGRQATDSVGTVNDTSDPSVQKSAGWDSEQPCGSLVSACTPTATQDGITHLVQGRGTGKRRWEVWMRANGNGKASRGALSRGQWACWQDFPPNFQRKLCQKDVRHARQRGCERATAMIRWLGSAA